ncbi:MAG TPA: hypothetical protein VJ521_03835, partial [Acidobacteriota bacterium]|nr:hypothetical protein [Acidobacteriota bacterium]
MDGSGFNTHDTICKVGDRAERDLRRAVVPAVIGLLTLIAYSNSFSVPFQFDDLRLIRFNFSLRDLADWKNALLSERFRPLLAATFALNYQIGQSNPFAYHVVNFCIHLANVLLLFRLLSRHASYGVAAISAVIIAVHPLNVESVTYISSRSILLCSFFYLLAISIFDAYLRKRTWFYFSAFLLFFFL